MNFWIANSIKCLCTGPYWNFEAKLIVFMRRLWTALVAVFLLCSKTYKNKILK